jgi:hypothetical protein
MTEPVHIFIDDERDPPPGDWRVARSEAAFRDLLRDHSPAVISFDHDLGCDETGRAVPSGQHCMHHLIDQAMARPAWFNRLRLIILHSANPVGRANMRGLIESAGRHNILPDVRVIERPVTQYPIANWERIDTP